MVTRTIPLAGSSAGFVFTTMPEVHSSSGEATPINGRTSTDGKTVGAWNVVHDGVAGDLFHFTTGTNSVSNANGAIIAMGIDEYGTGLVIRNKKGGIGFNLQQIATVNAATAYAMVGTQASSVAPFMHLVQQSSANLIELVASSAGAGSRHLAAYDNAATNFAGGILADTGLIDWRRTIQTLAVASGDIPLIRVADEAAFPSEAFLRAKTATGTGLHLYVNSGSGVDATSTYATAILASSDRLKFQVGNGPHAKAAETLATAFEMQAHAAGARLAFFNATPVVQQTAPSSLSTGGSETNANICTAVNAVRTALNNLGLTA